MRVHRPPTAAHAVSPHDSSLFTVSLPAVGGGCCCSSWYALSSEVRSADSAFATASSTVAGRASAAQVRMSLARPVMNLNLSSLSLLLGEGRQLLTGGDASGPRARLRQLRQAGARRPAPLWGHAPA